MIDRLKEKVWEILAGRDVSLALIYDEQGRVLWHRGREIGGDTLAACRGICQEQAERVRTRREAVRAGGGLANLAGDALGDPPGPPIVKSLLVLPIGERYTLYVDSGCRQAFDERDLAAVETLGALLGELVDSLRRGGGPLRGIAGPSPLAGALREKAVRYAIEDEPVLLGGESGAGKSFLGELIHLYSGRPGAYVVVHCPTVPEALFESEVFGHRRGAFTGAARDRDGLLAQAQRGTLLFDEIADVPVSFQAKLLRFIETGRYRRLGEEAERQADVRLLAATNQDIRRAVEEKRFRADLYYRLAVLTVQLPPLRERRQDIAALVEENAGRLLRGRRLTPGAWQLVLGHDWPGNVRQLFNVLRRAAIESDGDVDRALLARILAGDGGGDAAPDPEGRVERAWRQLAAGASFWEAVKAPFLERDLNRDQVRLLVGRARLEAGGSWKASLPRLNIPAGQYKKFLDFLRDQRLN